MQRSSDRIGSSLGRRDFLRLSTGATLVATSGCTVAAWLDPGPPSALADQGPIALTPRRFHILAKLVEAMYPERPGFPSGLQANVPQRIDRELHFISAHTKDQIDLAIDVLEYGGLFAGWFGRFSRLEAARRLQGLEAMLDHSWETYRQVATALTQLVKGMYYTDSATWAGIGYDGPWMPPNVPESIAAYPDYEQES